MVTVTNDQKRGRVDQLVRALPADILQQWPAGWLTPRELLAALTERAILYEEWGVLTVRPDGSNEETWSGRREHAEQNLRRPIRPSAATRRHLREPEGERGLIRRLHVVLPREVIGE